MTIEMALCAFAHLGEAPRKILDVPRAAGSRFVDHDLILTALVTAPSDKGLKLPRFQLPDAISAYQKRFHRRDWSEGQTADGGGRAATARSKALVG
jgi:hypothetical protein